MIRLLIAEVLAIFVKRVSIVEIQASLRCLAHEHWAGYVTAPRLDQPYQTLQGGPVPDQIAFHTHGEPGRFQVLEGTIPTRFQLPPAVRVVDARPIRPSGI